MRLLTGRRSPIAGALLFFGTACADLGPGSNSASIAIAPTFSRDAAAQYQSASAVGLTIDNARLRLTRVDGEVARDITIAIAPGQDSLVIDLRVTITPPSEVFTALLELRSGEQVLFRGLGVVVAVADGAPQVPLIPMIYVGPVAAVVSKLVLVSTRLSGIVGQVLAQPLAVRAVTADDVPVPGIPVTWTVLSGGASVGQTSTLTDANGLASTPVTLGILLGTQTIQAATAGVSLLITLSALPGPLLPTPVHLVPGVTLRPRRDFH